MYSTSCRDVKKLQVPRIVRLQTEIRLGLGTQISVFVSSSTHRWSLDNKRTRGAEFSNRRVVMISGL